MHLTGCDVLSGCSVYTAILLKDLIPACGHSVQRGIANELLPNAFLTPNLFSTYTLPNVAIINVRLKPLPLLYFWCRRADFNNLSAHSF